MRGEIWQPTTDRIVGTRDELLEDLHQLRFAQQLGPITAVRPLGRDRYEVTYIRLLPRATPARPRRPLRLALAAVVATVGLFAVGFALAQYAPTRLYVTRALEVTFGLLVAALVLGALSRVGVCCPGLHCPGCPHGRR